MIPPFDAIRNGDGEPVWIGTERTLEHAKSYVASRGAKRPVEYLIVSLQTGHKEAVTVARPSDGSTA
jgi:hypothetical protein